MHDLVKLAIEAHGGLDRWNRVRSVALILPVSGPAMKLRGPVGEAFTQMPMRATVHTREQKVTLDPFLVPGHRGIYEPYRAAIGSPDGAIIEELINPRDSLKTMPPGTA